VCDGTSAVMEVCVCVPSPPGIFLISSRLPCGTGPVAGLAGEEWEKKKEEKNPLECNHNSSTTYLCPLSSRPSAAVPGLPSWLPVAPDPDCRGPTIISCGTPVMP
jgi:hypothetical protein